MLYVGVALMLTTAISVGQRELRPKYAAAGVVAYAIIVGPWIAALSTAKGRFTTGEIGRIVVSWFVNDVTPIYHWQGLPEGMGRPVHTTRQLLANPHVYEFADPFQTTYPPHFDSSYWYEGVMARLNIPRIIDIATGNARAFVALLLPLILIGSGLAHNRDRLRRLAMHWPLILPMLVGIGLFIVLYFETRYVAAFVAVIYLATLQPVVNGGNDESESTTATPRQAMSLVLALVLYVAD
jgi:hypothetical protein